MTDEEIKRWRQETRARLVAARLAIGAAKRRRWEATIEQHLQALFDTLPGPVLGLYWPFRAEFDPRPVAEILRAEGWRLALPAVVEKRGPLEYRRWQPGVEMETGAFDLPAPKARDVVAPDVVLAPVVGFDAANYRLGYGGGYFDRTLTALSPRPVAIGVGFALARLPTIFPRPDDVPMDAIVTEAGVQRRAAA